jgi:hypothetical protein
MIMLLVIVLHALVRKFIYRIESYVRFRTFEFEFRRGEPCVRPRTINVFEQ